MLASDAGFAAQDEHRFVLRDLEVGYRAGPSVVPVVAGVSFAVTPGKILGVAGESGSGKTTAVLAAIGYQAGGAVRLAGESRLGDAEIFALPPAQRRQLWSQRISYVAQDAAGALNPAFRIGAQLREILQVNAGLGREQAHERSRELLAAVRLPDPEAMLQRFPHQCSGGQLQRVAIAMAIACAPELIVCDEPTTGLDVTTQAEVVQMLAALIRERRMAAIYISHDLSLLSEVADELAIFYAGEIVESGPTAALLHAPRHPYTRALLEALPSARHATAPVGLPGFPPRQVVSGACAFAPRCSWVIPACRESHPELQPVDAGAARLVRCHRSWELAPILELETLRPPPLPTVTAAPATPLLTVRDLCCTYGRGSQRVEAVREVSLDLDAGEVVALVGESGSGKSTIGRAIVGLTPPVRGQISFAGELLPAAGRRSREQARAIQIIFQNPDSSLNPRHTVGALIGRSLELFRHDVGRGERKSCIAEALAEVRLDPEMMGRYPHQLSGGQKQRVAIARAFVAQPRLVICDEIVSGQDVSVQAAILELMRAMQERYQTALLFISHDLAVVRSIAQRVLVIQRGQIVESGATEQVFEQPQAAYTRTLLASVLEPERPAVPV